MAESTHDPPVGAPASQSGQGMHLADPTANVPLPSPFLPSSPDALPTLKSIAMPLGAVMEFQQQTYRLPVDLPIPRARSPIRVTSEQPTVSCPPAFKYAFNGFATARRCVSPLTKDEAEAMVSSETFELIAFQRGDEAKFGSVPPRAVCVDLVIPSEAVKNDNTIPLIDGFAALSDGKSKDGVPLATKVRFNVFGGTCSVPIVNAVRRDSFDQNTIDTVSIVVRWSDLDAEGNPRVRSESLNLGVTTPQIEECARYIQQAVVKVSVSFGIKLPAEFFATPPTPYAGYFEKQIVDCTNALKAVLHHEDTFAPSEEMKRTDTEILVRVPGCYVRICPKARGLAGVTSNEVIHAVLLCAQGKETKASQYCKTYREGLRPPDGEDLAMDLHTIALQVERVDLNGMISLYGHGGRSGEPIKADGNWLYRTSAAVVPLGSLMDRFFVMSCSMHSMLPSNNALTKYMERHMQKAMDFFDKLFSKAAFDDETSGTSSPTFQLPLVGSPPCIASLGTVSEEDRFVYSALGVDVKSKRMLIGEAIGYLMQTGAPTSLVEMLTASGAQVGLGSRLCEGYAYCTEAIKKSEKKNQIHEAEVARLKRVADAALLLCANKRACRPPATVTPEKVRSLMKVFNLKPGSQVTKMDDFLTTPRYDELAHSLVWTVYEAYTRRSNEQKDLTQLAEVQQIFVHYTDLVYALCKSLQVCMCSPPEHDAHKDADATKAKETKAKETKPGSKPGGKPRGKPGVEPEAFVVVHGNEMSNVSIYQVLSKGEPEPCGCGRVFEATKPAIVILRLRSDRSCIITPLVVDAVSR